MKNKSKKIRIKKPKYSSVEPSVSVEHGVLNIRLRNKVVKGGVPLKLEPATTATRNPEPDSDIPVSVEDGVLNKRLSLTDKVVAEQEGVPPEPEPATATSDSESDISGPIGSIWTIWSGGHGERMKNLYETGFLGDCTVFVGASRMPLNLHRMILEAGSPVFHEMFNYATNNELTIPDVEVHVFGLFMRHLYVGDSKSMCLEDSFLASFEDTEVLALLKLGSDFQVADLADLCARVLKSKLCDENVVDVFQKSMEYGHEDLIQSSLMYFCRNGWKLVEAEEFVDLQQECLYEILKQDDLRVLSESQLYNSLIRWGEAECDRQKMEPGDSENIQKVIQNLLGLIRFPMMAQADFSLNVALKNVLDHEELVPILLYFTVPLEQRSKINLGRFNSTPRNYYVEENDGGNSTELVSLCTTQTANNRLFVYRYNRNTCVAPKWDFVNQKREVLWFYVNGIANETINLEGFICKFCRDSSREIHFNDNWSTVILNCSVSEIIYDKVTGIPSEQVIMRGAWNVGPNWEFKFDKHVPIRSCTSYSLTVELTGFVKSVSKHTGAVTHMSVKDKELYLEAGVDLQSNIFFRAPFAYGVISVHFDRLQSNQGPAQEHQELLINQGFIDALILSI